MEGSGFNININNNNDVNNENYPNSPMYPGRVGPGQAVGEECGIPTRSEGGEGGNVGGGSDNKKVAAWNKTPSNGSGDSGRVMDGAWPALSESAKASPQLSPSESLKNLSDSGSNNVSQGTGVALSFSLSSSSLQSQLQSSVASQKPMTGTGSAIHNQTPSHGRPARQKSMKRDGGGNIEANGSLSHQNSPSEGSHNHNSYGKPGSGNGYESSTRDNMQNPVNRDNRNAGVDHPQQRNSFRRGNSGPHSRGDGSHQNYGGRRGDHDRGNHDWNHQRSFNGRDAPIRPRGVSPRGYARGPSVSAPFPHPGPAAMHPFGNLMFVPDFPVFYVPPGMPFVAPFPAPMYFPEPDPQLKAKLLNQIDYYFSNENLVKDIFLRQNMDDNGWVPVELIAGFKKVTQLTDNIQLILDAVQSSSVVEAQGVKIRRRGDYMRWIMPSSVKFPNVAGLQSPTSPNVSTLSSRIARATIVERGANVNGGPSLRPFQGDLNSSPSHSSKDIASSSGC